MKKWVLTLLTCFAGIYGYSAPCDTAYFAYADTTFCNASPAITPLTVSTPNGYFSASGFGLDVDSSGAITPGTSTPGSYTLYFVVQDSCADSFAVSITVLPQGNADFSYPDSIFCTPTTNPLAIVSGDTGGVFAGSASLVLDSITGEINLPASTPGGHWIQYAVDSLCPDTATINVFIYPQSDGSFAYQDSTLCSNGPSEIPLIPGDTGGVFFSGPGLALAPATGAVTPGSSTPGTYIVSYGIAGPCGDTATQSLQVIAAPSPGFNYPPNICTVDTSNPVPSVVTPGGTFFEQTGNLVFQNPTTGEINLAATLPGSYVVRYTTAATCPDSMTNIVSVAAQTDPSFHYPDTAYCDGGLIAAPVVLGNGGGTYWSADTTLALDAGTGFVNLAASDTGSYTVLYASPGFCPDTAAFTLEIVPQGVSSFAYVPAEFCKSDPNPLPIISGDTNGTFSVVSGSAIIDPNTGEIDLSQSPTGDSILIMYRVPGPVQSCPDSSFALVRIVEPDTSINITYPQAHYCPDEGNAIPVLVGPSGGTFQATPPTLNFVSPFTGEIDIDQSPPGTYLVQYFAPGSCTDTSSGFWITISPQDVLSLGYPASEFCKSDSFAAPFNLPDSAGTFSEPSGFLIFGDAALGNIDLDSSKAGNYIVSYRSGGACPADTSFPIQVHASPDPMLITTADLGTICEGDSMDFAAFGGDRFEYRVNDSVVVPLGFQNQYFPGASMRDGDRVTVRAVNDIGGCSAWDTIDVRVLPSPSISFLEYDEKISSGTTIEINLQVDQDSFVVHWSYFSEGPVSPPADTGVSPLLRAANIFHVEADVDLTNPNTVGRVHFLIQPQAGGCTGRLDTLDILIVPGDDIFIPGVITPDGNGKNDKWELRYADSVNPDNYHIEVFNRSGGLVYEQDGLAPIWDGGSLPDAVYWYIIKGTSSDRTYTGGLTIRRK